WLKIKAPQEKIYVIGGYTPSAAAGGIGALCMGEWVDGELVYRGKVGTGFDAATMAALLQRLQGLTIEGRLDGAPKDMIAVKPVLSAKIRLSNVTADGLIRHGVFNGLREVELSAAPQRPRKRYVSDADLAGIWVTNPTRRLFGRSGPTKLDIAVYYAAVGDFMLPHLIGRPVSLFRCPTGKPND